MSFLRKLDHVAHGPLFCEPWTASHSEALAEFSDWVDISRLGVVPAERASAYLTDRLRSFQKPQNSMEH